MESAGGPLVLALRSLRFLSASKIPFFIESFSFVDEIAPVQSVPRPNWYVVILQRGFEGVFVAFLLATSRALSLL